MLYENHKCQLAFLLGCRTFCITNCWSGCLPVLIGLQLALVARCMKITDRVVSKACCLPALWNGHNLLRWIFAVWKSQIVDRVVCLLIGSQLALVVRKSLIGLFLKHAVCRHYEMGATCWSGCMLALPVWAVWLPVVTNVARGCLKLRPACNQ